MNMCEMRELVELYKCKACIFFYLSLKINSNKRNIMV